MARKATAAAKRAEIQPPLPTEVNLSDMVFMPLHDNRLMKSRAWLEAKNWRGPGPGLAFCIMNLWVGAFRSVPAGSLDDDDDILADVARVDVDHWRCMKSKAIRGWQSLNGRLWHPVVCQLAWELWMARLESRHARAIDAHRAAAKRALDKGLEPSDPPGEFLQWMEQNYQASYNFRERTTTQQYQTTKISGRTDTLSCPSDFEPKRSKAKQYISLSPATNWTDARRQHCHRDAKADGKRWFAGELARLEDEFRPMLGVMLTNLQMPGIVGAFGLVKSFKGCWLESGADGNFVIVARSKVRADAIVRQHRSWLFHYWPDLVVRHAKVDELRARSDL